ncbi:unnamed protein product [Mesocestoides corti]|uniref:Uncharacterized protein n=2 Tax=Mesocestoides corti TaxID=53468 RepID=A0A0R3UJA8_MESCO|nr:unnamed protein product [Mesocestoides corti]
MCDKSAHTHDDEITSLWNHPCWVTTSSQYAIQHRHHEFVSRRCVTSGIALPCRRGVGWWGSLSKALFPRPRTAFLLTAATISCPPPGDVDDLPPVERFQPFVAFHIALTTRQIGASCASGDGSAAFTSMMTPPSPVPFLVCTSWRHVLALMGTSVLRTWCARPCFISLTVAADGNECEAARTMARHARAPASRKHVCREKGVDGSPGQKSAGAGRRTQ